MLFIGLNGYYYYKENGLTAGLCKVPAVGYVKPIPYDIGLIIYIPSYGVGIGADIFVGAIPNPPLPP